MHQFEPARRGDPTHRRDLLVAGVRHVPRSVRGALDGQRRGTHAAVLSQSNSRAVRLTSVPRHQTRRVPESMRSPPTSKGTGPWPVARRSRARTRASGTGKENGLEPERLQRFRQSIRGAMHRVVDRPTKRESERARSVRNHSLQSAQSVERVVVLWRGLMRTTVRMVAEKSLVTTTPMSAPTREPARKLTASLPAAQWPTVAATLVRAGQRAVRMESCLHPDR